MKRLFYVIPMVCLLCFAFSCQKAEEEAEEPAVDVEAEKQAVAEFFKSVVDAAVAGNFEKNRSSFHPEMQWWDFSQEHPVGIEAYTKIMEDFYKLGLKWVCDLGPFDIHVAGNTAVLYTTYKNIFKDPEGNETTESGLWTAVFTKQDDKWLFLSNIFIGKK